MRLSHLHQKMRWADSREGSAYTNQLDFNNR